VHSGEIRRWTLSRSRLTEFFGNMAPAIIAMEACGSSHHWARRFSAMGHDVRMIATKFVRPFVKTNKTDAADAAAGQPVSSQPGSESYLAKAVRVVAYVSSGLASAGTLISEQ
jgi:transposase